ncbi:transposase [Methylocystis sp. H4A]|nr:transposase [Methylocystis sp. H4A]
MDIAVFSTGGRQASGRRPPGGGGLVYVIKHGPQWKAVPKDYGPYKTLCNRFIRWSRLAVSTNPFDEVGGLRFDPILAALSRDAQSPHAS